ncbi:MAG: response regulator [Acidobacteriia bacterium]|nr:response regulator [Terriglobia bacterium]
MSARILVVDDEPTIQEFAATALGAAAYEVACARTGLDALRLARREHFDLVLLDINMPEMDGWETLRLLKADEAIRDLPVMMFSVKGEARDKVHGLQEGAADYLTKPFGVDELLSRVRRVLSGGGARAGSLPRGA